MVETASAGATPVAGGATPLQTPSPATATPETTDSATEFPEGLGDPGKQALTRMKQERDAARREAADAKKRADELETAGKSEHERAVADAKKEGATEATGKYVAMVRASSVKAALLTAGVDPSLVELAARADQFASLKVTDEGDVEGLEQAVDAFKRSTPNLFAKPKPPTDAGLGPRGTAAAGGVDMNTHIRRAAGRA
jgi:hypothetical protein